MRVLVVGAYPPYPGRSAQVTRDEVRALLLDGHDVHVLSPRPSAAHTHAALVGVRGAFALARRSRRFDKVIVRLGPGLFLRRDTRHLARVRRLVDVALLGGALRLWRHGTLQIDDLSCVPGSVGGRSGLLLWTSVDEVVVADEVAKRAVHGGSGLPVERIVVRPLPPAVDIDPLATGPADVTPGSPPPEWSVAAETPWADVLSQVRERAAAERSTARSQQPVEASPDLGFEVPVATRRRPFLFRAAAKAAREAARVASRFRT